MLHLLRHLVHGRHSAIRTLALILIFGAYSLGCSEAEEEEQTTVQTPPVPAAEDARDEPVPAVGEPEPPPQEVNTSQPPPDVVQRELERASVSVENAKLLFPKAPAGKGSDLALADLKQKLGAAQDLLQEGWTHLENQQLSLAKDKAEEAMAQANTVAQQLTQAIDTANFHTP